MRKLIFKIHLWVGFSIGLLLVVAGLTGTALVFDDEIDAALHPELRRVAPAGDRLSMERILRSVTEAYPDVEVAYIRMPRDPQETYEITTAGVDPRQIFVDPYRGTVVGSRGTTEGFVNTLFDLHVHLLSGENGERVMGAVGVLTLLLVATGAVVWWPRSRRWRDGFIVRRGTSWKRTNFDLHRAGGIWSAAFLALTAATGAGLIFHDAFLALANRVTASAEVPPIPEVPPGPGERWLPLDTLLVAAERALPGGTVTYISFPTSERSPLSVRKHFPAALHPNGRSFVYLNPWSGEVAGVENALAVPPGTRALNVLYPLHIGSFGGLAVRIVYALLGLTPLILFVTGCVMWWNRTRAPRRRRDARRTQTDVAPEASGGRTAVG